MNSLATKTRWRSNVAETKVFKVGLAQRPASPTFGKARCVSCCEQLRRAGPTFCDAHALRLYVRRVGLIRLVVYETKAAVIILGGLSLPRDAIKFVDGAKQSGLRIRGIDESVARPRQIILRHGADDQGRDKN
jgi:hypothetical protein